MNKINKEIVYLVSSETSKGVLESQVFAKANYISHISERNVKVVLVGKKITINNRNRFKNLEFYFLGEDISIRDISNSLIYIRTVDVFLKNFVKVKLKGNTIIYDFRAFLFAESYGRNRSLLKSSFIFFLEMLVYLLADRICTVSNQLKKRLQLYFLIKRKVFVFPCLVYKDSNRIKSDLIKSGKIRFVYLGGLSEWQKFDDILSLYKDLSRRLDNTSLTIITKDKETAKKKALVKEIDCNVISLSNHEVFDELQNYDFGFLVREDNLINNVASPIKFLEYLEAGVIPLMTKGIGDYSEEASIEDIAHVFSFRKEFEDSDVENIVRLFKDKKLQGRIDKYLGNYYYKTRINNHPILNL